MADAGRWDVGRSVGRCAGSPSARPRTTPGSRTSSPRARSRPHCSGMPTSTMCPSPTSRPRRNATSRTWSPRTPTGPPPPGPASGAWLMRATTSSSTRSRWSGSASSTGATASPLVFSHRSYLDGWVLPTSSRPAGSPRRSPSAVRTSTCRSSARSPATPGSSSSSGPRRAAGLPAVAAGYVAHHHRASGQSRLVDRGWPDPHRQMRPPVHGILRYLADAVEAEPGPDVYVVPIAIVYDQLHEVAGMTAEARGAIRPRGPHLAGQVRPLAAQPGWAAPMSRSVR